MGLPSALSYIMRTPTFNPTFITRPIFPIRLLKNSLNLVEKLKLKKLKKIKNLGGLIHVHMTQP